MGNGGRDGSSQRLHASGNGPAGPIGLLAASLSQAPAIHQWEQHPGKVCRVSSCISRRWELDCRGSGFHFMVGEEKRGSHNPSEGSGSFFFSVAPVGTVMELMEPRRLGLFLFLPRPAIRAPENATADHSWRESAISSPPNTHTHTKHKHSNGSKSSSWSSLPFQRSLGTCPLSLCLICRFFAVSCLIGGGGVGGGGLCFRMVSGLAGSVSCSNRRSGPRATLPRPKQTDFAK